MVALFDAFAMRAVLAHGNTRRADEVIAKGLEHVSRVDDRPLRFVLELRGLLMEWFLGDVSERDRLSAAGYFR